MEKQELIKDWIASRDSRISPSLSGQIEGELKTIFLAEHPEVLDDDINEAFDRWLALEVEAYENLMDLKARANDDE